MPPHFFIQRGSPGDASPTPYLGQVRKLLLRMFKISIRIKEVERFLAVDFKARVRPNFPAQVLLVLKAICKKL